MDDETQPLLSSQNDGLSTPLGVFFATFCIVDLFGVFPIIALPQAIINCGWLGVPLALVVFGIQIYTAILLGRCWLIAEKLQPSIISKSRYPYAALADLTFGRNVRHLVSFLLDVTIFGAGVPNLLVASQNLQLVGLRMSQDDFNVSYCYWMVIMGILLCPIMWLGSPKDMKCVTALSVATVLFVAVFTWTCMILDDTVPQNPSLPPPTWGNVAIAYGILAFQFDIHPMILTVQVDMEDKRKLGQAIGGGFIVTTSLFLTTTLIAIFRYGSSVRSNVLQGLPASYPLYLDVLFVTAQICISMVVSESALFQDLEDKLNVPRVFNWRRCALRSALMLVTVVIGESVPRFDLVMGLIGGALTGPLMFVLPPLIYARLRVMSCKDMLPKENAEEDALCFKELDHTSKEIITGGVSQREAQATHKLFSDCVYRDLEENPPRKPGFWRKCSAALKNVLSLEGSTEGVPMTMLEMASIGCIVVLGAVATVTVTISCVWDTVRYARFSPPCIR